MLWLWHWCNIDPNLKLRILNTSLSESYIVWGLDDPNTMLFMLYLFTVLSHNYSQPYNQYGCAVIAMEHKLLTVVSFCLNFNRFSFLQNRYHFVFVYFLFLYIILLSICWANYYLCNKCHYMMFLLVPFLSNKCVMSIMEYGGLVVLYLRVGISLS